MAENTGGAINRQLLKSKSGEFDIESIHTLVLRDLSIQDLGCLGECSVLERLDLSRNELTRLYALAGLTTLTHLNLSANRISSLEGLQSLDNLQSLNLSGNLIGSADTLRCLSTLEKLTDVRLQDQIHELRNPVCMSNTYRQQVLNVLPNIDILDGERLRGKGSELYTMCREMDELLVGKLGQESFKAVPESGPWVTEDFWQPNLEKFNNSSLADAEQQLQDMLAQCQRVSEQGQVKIDEAFAQFSSAATKITTVDSEDPHRPICTPSDVEFQF